MEGLAVPRDELGDEVGAADAAVHGAAEIGGVGEEEDVVLAHLFSERVGQRVAEDAQKISAVGRELSERMANLVEHLSHMGGALGKTVKAYNQAVASLESRVLPTARKLESLGVGSRKPIESLRPIDQAVRQIVPQQLTLEP